MRERMPKLVSLVAAIVMFALLACAVVLRFSASSATGGAEDASEVAKGPSAGLGDSRQRLGSYVSTLALGSGSFDGEVYRFDGTNICIETLCSASGAGAEPSATFMVELCRLDYGLVEVSLGSRTLSSRGLSSATWDGVGPGEYFFRFIKEDDGFVLRSTNVWMYSYWEE